MTVTIEMSLHEILREIQEELRQPPPPLVFFVSDAQIQFGPLKDQNLKLYKTTDDIFFLLHDRKLINLEIYYGIYGQDRDFHEAVRKFIGLQSINYIGPGQDREFQQAFIGLQSIGLGPAPLYKKNDRYYLYKDGIFIDLLKTYSRGIKEKEAEWKIYIEILISADLILITNNIKPISIDVSSLRPIIVDDSQASFTFGGIPLFLYSRGDDLVGLPPASHRIVSSASSVIAYVLTNHFQY